MLIDGASADALTRDAQGTLLLALPEGVHVVTLRGAVPETEALRLVFRERPAYIQVNAPGWQVAGVDEGRLLADSLALIRPVRPSSRDGSADAAPAQREEFPPFVRVTRTLRLGLDWTVTTGVERLAPEQGAFTLRLPLLPGESVLTAGLPVTDREVELAMPAGVAHAGWTSALDRAESLELTAPAAAPYVEVWRFEVGPSWHLGFEGTPEVLAPEPDGPQWVHRFEPRPSETLRVTVTRPAAIEGPTFAFESVQHRLTPGRRSTDVLLEIDYRSTQGGRHVIGLPEGARLTQVFADGAPLALRAQDGELELPLQPGAHQLRIEWQTDTGVSLATRPGVVTLGAPASNVATTIVMPPNRWLLAAAGDGVGPAILYWAELAVFVVVALLLGRPARTPLATHEWLLVGLRSQHVLVGRAAALRRLGVRPRLAPPLGGERPAAVVQRRAGPACLAHGRRARQPRRGDTEWAPGIARHARHGRRQPRRRARVVRGPRRSRSAATGRDLGVDLVLQGGDAGLGALALLRARSLGAVGVGGVWRRRTVASTRPRALAVLGRGIRQSLPCDDDNSPKLRKITAKLRPGADQIGYARASWNENAKIISSTSGPPTRT